MTGLTSRRKGQTGERELAALIADLTGWDVRRRVRQHEGDSDLEGVPGWSVEVKRHAKAPDALKRAWWAQTVRQSMGMRQAVFGNTMPALFYREDRREWRAIWPVACLLTMQRADMWTDYGWTCDSDVATWAAVAREVMG